MCELPAMDIDAYSNPSGFILLKHSISCGTNPSKNSSSAKTVRLERACLITPYAFLICWNSASYFFDIHLVQDLQSII